MSVLSYLTELSSRLVITQEEKLSIAKSISSLRSNIIYWDRNSSIQEQLVFGSFERDTILPRWADEDSDVDYMIVFKNQLYSSPQTFLNKLRDFTNRYYSRSINRQSFPAIVLELNHIKFDLVPAYNNWGNYMIPLRSSNYLNWQNTDLNTVKQRVRTANVFNSNIRPLIRLLKYWNAQKGKLFASYELELMIASLIYDKHSNLEDCFNTFVDSIFIHSDYPQYKKNAINSLKNKVNSIRDCKHLNDFNKAEELVKSIFE